MNGILPAPPSGPPHASCALAGRAAIERELRSLSAQRERLEAGNAAPAAPSGELADDPLGLSELKRRQRVASDRLDKLDQQISTRTRALPLYEELLRDTRRAQATIDDITARFGGRENMLVEFPDGEQGTLREGLQRLQHDKWRG